MTTPPNALRRSEKSHRAIVTAALDLCIEQGYGKVTVEAIAARAGVSKKTIYRWWPTKGAVVLEAMIDLAGAATQFPDTGDIAADMRTQMTAVVEHIMTGPHGAMYAGLIAETQHDEDLARGLLDQLLAPRIAAARARLSQARDQGQLAADTDVSLVVDLLYGPIYYRVLLHLGPYSREQLHVLIDTVIGAFAPAATGSDAA